ncbi:MAG: DUF493 domain-containing protein [Gammaproteobacteria bacterium]|nr:DUF493 domain-containing protein [Gammaproteobacteria bacterium]
MTGKESLIEFPADIAVKAMGHAADDFEQLVHDLVAPHLSEGQSVTLSTLDSSKGKYSSVSVRFVAQNQQQLEAIYQDLHASERILFTL